MSARVTGVRVKDGKLVKVTKLSASKKIGQKAKAERQTRAWKSKSKPRT